MCLPYADPERTLSYLMKERVDYLVLVSGEARSFPTVREWLANGISDRNATLIYDRRGPDDVHLAIYRLQHDTPM